MVRYGTVQCSTQYTQSYTCPCKLRYGFDLGWYFPVPPAKQVGTIIILMQYDRIQYLKRYHTIQYSTILYIYNTIRCGMVWNTMQCNAMQPNVTHHNTTHNWTTNNHFNLIVAVRKTIWEKLLWGEIHSNNGVLIQCYDS